MRVPKLCKNGDGRAFATIPKSGKKRIYFGVWGSSEANQMYAEWIKQISVADPFPILKATPKNYKIVDLAVKYLEYAEKYYASTNDKHNGEFKQSKVSIGHLTEFQGLQSAETIGPKMIESLQRHLVEKGLSRRTLNQRVGRVKRFLKWCAAQELIPPEKYHSLLCVSGLRKGQYGVKDTEEVKPVLWKDASQVLPYVTPHIATMIEVQYLCGMRPQDVTNMRPCDIDQSGEIWLYRPEEHKTAYLGAVLVKAIPVPAQLLLAEYLQRDAEAYLFSPKESQQWRYDNQIITSEKKRKTKVYPCELKRRERMKKQRRATRDYGKFGDKYTTGTYHQAVKRGFEKAEKNNVAIPRWSPNQLRHSIATEISAAIGEQSAQRYLGHKHLETTGIYAEKRTGELVEVALQIGAILGR